MTDAEPCPACGEGAAGRPGPVVTGTIGLLWWKRRFEERLFRCHGGHLYSVRMETRGGRTVTIEEEQESVETWIRERAGVEPPTGPPGGVT